MGEGRSIEFGVFEKSYQGRMSLPTNRFLKSFDTFADFFSESHVILSFSGRDIFSDVENISLLLGSVDSSKVLVSGSSGNIEFFSLLQWLKEHGAYEHLQHFNDDVQCDVGKGNKITVVFGGYPWNFSGYTPGVYFQNIQGTLGLLFGACVQAHTIGSEQQLCWLQPDAVTSEAISKRFIIYNWQLQRHIVQLLFAINGKQVLRDDLFKLELFRHKDETELNSYFRFAAQDGSGQSYAKFYLGASYEIPKLSHCLKEGLINNSFGWEQKPIQPNEYLNDAKYWNLPYFPEEKTLVPRSELLTQINLALNRSHKVALVDCYAKGGVGKTFLALDIAKECKKKCNLNVFWFNAENNLLSFEYDLFCSQVLGHQTCGVTSEGIIQVVKKELSSMQLQTLVIYDNVEDPLTLEKFLPEVNNNLSILLTSRKNVWDRLGFQSISITPFTPAEAKNLIGDETGELGRFPLTLSLVSNYLLVTKDFNFNDYKKLVERSLGNIQIAADKHEYSLVAWQISLDYILNMYREKRPLFLSVLIICAFLNPVAIPFFILEVCFNERFSMVGMKPRKEDVNEILGILERFSLLRYNFGVITIHRLVQKNIRDWVYKNEVEELKLSLGTILKVFYSGPVIRFCYFDNFAETLFKLNYLLPQLMMVLENTLNLCSFEFLCNFYVDVSRDKRLSAIEVLLEKYDNMASVFNGTSRCESLAIDIYRKSGQIIERLGRNVPLIEKHQDPKFIQKRLFNRQFNLFFTHLNSSEEKEALYLSKTSYFTFLAQEHFGCEKVFFGNELLYMHKKMLYHDVYSIYLALFQNKNPIDPAIHTQIKYVLASYKELFALDFQSVAQKLGDKSYGFDSDLICYADEDRRRRWGDVFRFETYLSIVLLSFLIGDLEQVKLSLQIMRQLSVIPKVQESAESALVDFLLGWIALKYEGNENNMAITYLQRSYIMYSQLQFNEPMIALSAYCLAEAYFDSKYYKMAEFYFKKALSIFNFFSIFSDLEKSARLKLNEIQEKIDLISPNPNLYQQIVCSIFDGNEQSEAHVELKK